MGNLQELEKGINREIAEFRRHLYQNPALSRAIHRNFTPTKAPYARVFLPSAGSRWSFSALILTHNKGGAI
jgi:hypothetical protein